MTSLPVTSGTESNIPDRWELTDENNRIYINNNFGEKNTCLQLRVTPEGYKQEEIANCEQHNLTEVNLQWRMFWTNSETFQIRPIDVTGTEDSLCLGVPTISPYKDDMLPCSYTDETSWSFDYLQNGHLYNPFYKICLVAISYGRVTGCDFKL